MKENAQTQIRTENVFQHKISMGRTILQVRTAG